MNDEEKIKELEEKLKQAEKTILSLREENVRLKSDASTDQLTGLPNRREFYQFLAEFQSLYVRNIISCYSVIAFDLDGFKAVNDTWGHQAGDACLQFIAEEIKNTLRVSDVFAREGGDEFLIILPGADENVAKKVARKVLFTVTHNVNERLKALLQSEEVFVSASFGLVSFCANARKDPQPEKEHILRLADYARTVVKSIGKGTILTLDEATSVDSSGKIWNQFFSHNS